MKVSLIFIFLFGRSEGTITRDQNSDWSFNDFWFSRSKSKSLLIRGPQESWVRTGPSLAGQSYSLLIFSSEFFPYVRYRWTSIASINDWSCRKTKKSRPETKTIFGRVHGATAPRLVDPASNGSQCYQESTSGRLDELTKKKALKDLW